MKRRSAAIGRFSGFSDELWKAAGWDVHLRIRLVELYHPSRIRNVVSIPWRVPGFGYMLCPRSPSFSAGCRLRSQALGGVSRCDGVRHTSTSGNRDLRSTRLNGTRRLFFGLSSRKSTRSSSPSKCISGKSLDNFNSITPRQVAISAFPRANHPDFYW